MRDNVRWVLAQINQAPTTGESRLQSRLQAMQCQLHYMEAAVARIKVAKSANPNSLILTSKAAAEPEESRSKLVVARTYTHDRKLHNWFDAASLDTDLGDQKIKDAAATTTTVSETATSTSASTMPSATAPEWIIDLPLFDLSQPPLCWLRPMIDQNDAAAAGAIFKGKSKAGQTKQRSKKKSKIPSDPRV